MPPKTGRIQSALFLACLYYVFICPSWQLIFVFKVVPNSLKELMEDWQTIKTLSLLAISANSYISNQAE